MSEPSSSEPRKARAQFEPLSLGGAVRRGALFLYALLAVGLAGLAVFMSAVVGRPLLSGYVAAPAIGALWFGLRVFMILGSRK